MLRETRWEHWRYGDHWARRLRHAARLSSRIVAISPHLRDARARAARRASRDRRGDPQRGGRGALRPAASSNPVGDWRCGGSGWSRSRTAGTSRGSPARFATERRTCTGSSRDDLRGAAPVLLFVGSLHRGEARAAPAARVRARARTFRHAGAARDLGRLHGRVGGRASACRCPRGRRAGDLLRRLARAHRAARGARLRRRDGRSLGPRRDSARC